MAKREPQPEAATPPPETAKQPATRYVVFKVLPNSALVKVWTGEAWSRRQASDRAAGDQSGRFAVCAVSGLEVFTYGVPDKPTVQLLGSSDASALEIVRTNLLEQPAEPPIPPPSEQGQAAVRDAALRVRGEGMPKPTGPIAGEDAAARVAAAIPGGELRPDLSGPDDDDEAVDDSEVAEGQVVPLNE